MFSVMFMTQSYLFTFYLGSERNHKSLTNVKDYFVLKTRCGKQGVRGELLFVQGRTEVGKDVILAPSSHSKAGCNSLLVASPLPTQRQPEEAGG